MYVTLCHNLLRPIHGMWLGWGGCSCSTNDLGSFDLSSIFIIVLFYNTVCKEICYLYLDPMEEQNHSDNGSEMGNPTVTLYMMHVIPFVILFCYYLCILF